MADKTDNRSLADLMAELSRETGTLVRKEVELATTEMTAKIREAATHVATASAGGALLHAGLLILLAAIVIALTRLGLQAWLSALIVALLTMVVGYVMLNKGMAALRRTQFAPRHTIESLKEDARWTTGQRA